MKATRSSWRSARGNGLAVESEGAWPRRKRFSAAGGEKVNALKERVTRQLAAQYASSLSATLIRQAVQEADALAAATQFPELFLPVLAEEKVRSAYVWSERQKRIQQETTSFSM